MVSLCYALVKRSVLWAFVLTKRLQRKRDTDDKVQLHSYIEPMPSHITKDDLQFLQHEDALLLPEHEVSKDYRWHIEDTLTSAFLCSIEPS